MVKLCGCCGQQRAMLRRPKTFEQVRMHSSAPGCVPGASCRRHAAAELLCQLCCCQGLQLHLQRLAQNVSTCPLTGRPFCCCTIPAIPAMASYGLAAVAVAAAACFVPSHLRHSALNLQVLCFKIFPGT
jgi:hypothetical protein